MSLQFEDLKLNKQLLNALADLNYETPTEIQAKAIPQIMAGHDIFGIAQTGTGKTAAYLLPIIMKIKYAQGNNPRVLILAPTRELAIQVNEQVALLTKYTDLRHTVIYGGIGPKTQIENVAKGIDILVATPGRLMDIYRTGVLILKEIKTLVLDEADKMMDMGFMSQIRQLLEIIPRKRQNLLFSATMPEKVVTLSEEFLEFPLSIAVTPPSSTAKAVDQEYYRVPNFRTKINLLQHIIVQEGFDRVMIFVRTKATADNVYKFLHRKVDENVRVIHSNKGQNTRINSMEAFKAGEIRILVSTDVASRGIDIPKVSHVINFDVPNVHEDYVHRIGRTGRASEVGKAITFANSLEVYHIAKIEKLINMKIKEKDLPKEVKIEETEFEEQQLMARELDRLKKIDDPSFQGAFHEKKSAIKAKAARNNRKKR
jgi:ATP-dependent RNA helicase RhlE